MLILLTNGYSWETVNDCEAEMSIDRNRQKKHSDLHCVINRNLAICGSSILYRDVCDLREVPHTSYRLAIQYVSCQGRTSYCLRFVIRLWGPILTWHLLALVKPLELIWILGTNKWNLLGFQMNLTWVRLVTGQVMAVTATRHVLIVWVGILWEFQSGIILGRMPIVISLCPSDAYYYLNQCWPRSSMQCCHTGHNELTATAVHGGDLFHEDIMLSLHSYHMSIVVIQITFCSSVCSG